MTPTEVKTRCSHKILLYLLILLGTIIVGCANSSQEAQGNSKLSPLNIIGDVDEVLQVASFRDFTPLETIQHRDMQIEAIALEALLQRAEPFSVDYEILFIGDDGLSALLTNEDLSQCYLTYNLENGWEAINFNHPISSNVKNISDIVVIAAELPLGKGFTIIDTSANLRSFSVGELYQQGYLVVSTLRGRASIEKDGKVLETTTSYRRKVVDLEEYFSFARSKKVAVIGQKGEVIRFRQDGYVELHENHLGYLDLDTEIDHVVGLVLDPPDRVITDVYHDTKKLLEAGEKVLLILIDGLGYYQFQYAVDKGYAPFLKSLAKPEMAMSAYPTVTPVNVAASLTGELPYINGVTDRGIRQASVPTIFAYCQEQGKKAIAVLGPIQTIDLEIDPVLCIDENEDGSTDDEKQKVALEKVSEEYDLLMVHYKDVDKTGHTYGPTAEERMQVIAKIDDYVRQVVSQWDGQVLIYADHGMHDTDEGGDHRHVIKEDIFTPYWLFDGKEVVR